MQVIGSALVIREQEQPESDLRHDQGLRQREQLCDRPPRPTPARNECHNRCGGADRDHQEGIHMVGR
jgi:hypothetical protein